MHYINAAFTRSEFSAIEREANKISIPPNKGATVRRLTVERLQETGKLPQPEPQT